MTGLSAAAAETLALHRRRVRRRVALMALLGALALAALLLDLATGPAGMPLGETLRALTGGEVSRGASVIVWQVRLPMALMALLVGAALGLAGAEMQTVLDNPLAEPFTLGDLRSVYEAVWGVDLDAPNFRRKVLSTPGFVVDTGETVSVGRGKPAGLYHPGEATDLHPAMLRPEPSRDLTRG